jgi:hypothetical protein
VGLTPGPAPYSGINPLITILHPFNIIAQSIFTILCLIKLSNFISYPTMTNNIETSHSVEELIARTQTCSCADNHLSLTPVKDPANPFELSLVGKICSPRNFLQSVVQEIVEKAWKLSHPILIKRVDRNIFLFSFGHEVDRQIAFNRRPWTIKGTYLVLKPCSPELSWQELDFTTSTFWVQIHGLPMLWQMEDNLKHIGRQIGSVLEIDFISEPVPHWRKFIRIRVEIDISKPLKSSFFLPRPGLHDIWIGLKYEKLPDFCYKCGIIGHLERDCCSEKTLLSNQYGVRFPEYGIWTKTVNNKEPPNIYQKPPCPDSIISENNIPGAFPAITDKVTNITVGTTLEGEGGTDQVDHTTNPTPAKTHIMVSSLAKLLASSLQQVTCTPRTCMVLQSNSERQNVSGFKDKTAL